MSQQDLRLTIYDHFNGTKSMENWWKLVLEKKKKNAYFTWMYHDKVS